MTAVTPRWVWLRSAALRGAQFAAGACVGSALDVLHVRHRVLEYARPFYRTGQAVWVPALFGSGGLVLGALSTLARRLWPGASKEAIRLLTRSGWLRVALFDAAQLVLAYVVTLFDTPPSPTSIPAALAERGAVLNSAPASLPAALADRVAALDVAASAACAADGLWDRAGRLWARFADAVERRPHGLRRLLVLLLQFVILHRCRVKILLRDAPGEGGGAWAWRRAAVAHAVACAVVGVLVEYVLVRLGAFRHIRPDVAGLPLWLPALYMNGAPLVATVHDALSAAL